MDRPPDKPANEEPDDQATLETSVELIRRAREGDRAAMDTLFVRYVPPLRRWASGRLPRWARDLVDTEDMVQEALIGTFRNLDRFEPRRDGAMHAYLRQALRHRIQDELRRAHRHPGTEEISPVERDKAASPLEEAIGSEALERYEAGLARLSDDDREAIVARVELGLDYGQIATALGKPTPDAARMAVSRALVRLAREMGHER